MSTLDHTLKPEASPVRRLEVITGTGRRRQFSEDFKSGIVEETLVPGAVVSDVARRHGKRCSGPTFCFDRGSVSLRFGFDRWA